MKKAIFAAILVGSFFITKISLAEFSPNNFEFRAIWDAINDLKNLVANNQGPEGPSGKDGISCWDQNGNRVRDLEEDKNQDKNFDALDCQSSWGDQASSNAGAGRYVYTIAITGSLDSADYSTLNKIDGAEERSYFMKSAIAQISESDLPQVSLYGKEDPLNIHLGDGAWENKSNLAYIKDGSIYILYAGKRNGQEPVYYLPKGVYKLVVVY